MSSPLLPRCPSPPPPFKGPTSTVDVDRCLYYDNLTLFFPQDWDDVVANVAQAWADGCQWRHDPDLGVQRHGQNLFVISPPGDTADLSRLGIFLWFNETEYHTFDTGECKSGEQCGHYTQVGIFA